MYSSFFFSPIHCCLNVFWLFGLLWGRFSTSMQWSGFFSRSVESKFPHLTALSHRTPMKRNRDRHEHKYSLFGRGSMLHTHNMQLQCIKWGTTTAAYIHRPISQWAKEAMSFIFMRRVLQSAAILFALLSSFFLLLSSSILLKPRRRGYAYWMQTRSFTIFNLSWPLVYFYALFSVPRHFAVFTNLQYFPCFFFLLPSSWPFPLLPFCWMNNSTNKWESYFVRELRQSL